MHGKLPVTPADHASTGRSLLAARPDRFLNTSELMVRAQQRVDAEPHQRVLRAQRFKPREHKIDPILTTVADDSPQNLGRSEIDLDDACRLEHQEPDLLRRGLDGRQHVAAEMIRIEKRQRRLESDDENAGLPFARKMRARRPPDRGSGHPFEYQHAGARSAPYAVQQRERDADTDAL